MTLAIMQPYFLPYIGYFQLMDTVDTFVLYDDVAFINRGWVNRNHVLINGQEFLFTVPLKEASQNKTIREITLADDTKWRSKLLKTIEQGYRKAPCYAVVQPLTEKIVNFATASLADYIRHSIDVVSSHIGLTTTLVPSSTIYQNGHLKAQERILDICQQTSATQYINPAGGLELYDKAYFAKAGIRLDFMKSTSVAYAQGKQVPFVPSLSILDVLMFNEPAAVKTMLRAFELV